MTIGTLAYNTSEQSSSIGSCCKVSMLQNVSLLKLLSSYNNPFQFHCYSRSTAFGSYIIVHRNMYRAVVIPKSQTYQIPLPSSLAITILLDDVGVVNGCNSPVRCKATITWLMNLVAKQYNFSGVFAPYKGNAIGSCFWTFLLIIISILLPKMHLNIATM